ncbi:MAG: hypothetical protein JW894_02770 [Bacteroidales bacterium]|nr:hypothetical protein [Bacteroidales bacterium]
MRNIFLILLMTLILGLSAYSQSEVFQSDKLEKIWEAKGLLVPESVLPVPEKGIMYVSNIGDHESKEKTGFISILDFDGKIKTLEWSEKLKAPKGMAINEGKLYVTEVDHITEIELSNGKVLNSYPVEGAVFLNDVAVGKNGVIYFTDSKTGTIYSLSEGKINVLVKDENYKFLNGIITVGNKVIFGTDGNVLKIDTETKEITECLANTGGVDGLSMIDKGYFIFSDWAGKVHIMTEGEEKELLLDTSETEKTKSADFGFVPEQDLILIPTFFDNSVVCYKLKR